MVDMQHARAARPLARNKAQGLVPQARTGPGTRDPSELRETVEEQVARVADLVLKVWALADRYEESMGRFPRSQQSVADQQARVETLRDAAERGRRRLITLAREA